MKDKLFSLMKVYPNMEVKFFVNSDEVCEDDLYTLQDIVKVEVTEWAEYGDKIYTDYCSLLSEICSDNDWDEDSAVAEEATLSLMEEVILVTLGA